MCNLKMCLLTLIHNHDMLCREVVALLRELKREATLLVVSHDLADIAPLVDCAWRMEMGGRMEAVQWPPDSLSDVED
jgi:energy-coupling factor transporter ATP-binding protein EcfA2